MYDSIPAMPKVKDLPKMAELFGANNSPANNSSIDAKRIATSVANGTTPPKLGSVKIPEALAAPVSKAFEIFANADAGDIVRSLHGDANLHLNSPELFRMHVAQVKKIQADPSQLGLKAIEIAPTQTKTLQEHKAQGDSTVLPELTDGAYHSDGTAIISADLIEGAKPHTSRRFDLATTMLEELIGEPLTQKLKIRGSDFDTGAAFASVMLGAEVDEAIDELKDEPRNTIKADILLNGKIVEANTRSFSGWVKHIVSQGVHTAQEARKELKELAARGLGVAEAGIYLASHPDEAAAALYYALSETEQAIVAGFHKVYDLSHEILVKAAKHIANETKSMVHRLADIEKELGSKILEKIMQPWVKEIIDALTHPKETVEILFKLIKDNIENQLAEQVRDFSRSVDHHHVEDDKGNKLVFNAHNVKDGEKPMTFGVMVPRSKNTNAISLDDGEEKMAEAFKSTVVTTGLEQLASLFGSSADKHRKHFEEIVVGRELTNEEFTRIQGFVRHLSTVASAPNFVDRARGIENFQDIYGVAFGSFGTGNKDFHLENNKTIGGLFVPETGLIAFGDTILKGANGDYFSQNQSASIIMEEIAHAALDYAGVKSEGAVDAGRATVNYIMGAKLHLADDGDDVIPDKRWVRTFNEANKIDSFRLPSGEYVQANTFKNGEAKGEGKTVGEPATVEEGEVEDAEEEDDGTNLRSFGLQFGANETLAVYVRAEVDFTIPEMPATVFGVSVDVHSYLATNGKEYKEFGTELKDVFSKHHPWNVAIAGFAAVSGSALLPKEVRDSPASKWLKFITDLFYVSGGSWASAYFPNWSDNAKPALSIGSWISGGTQFPVFPEIPYIGKLQASGLIDFWGAAFYSIDTNTTAQTAGILTAEVSRVKLDWSGGLGVNAFRDERNKRRAADREHKLSAIPPSQGQPERLTELVVFDRDRVERSAEAIRSGAVAHPGDPGEPITNENRPRLLESSVTSGQINPDSDVYVAPGPGGGTWVTESPSGDIYAYDSQGERKVNKQELATIFEDAQAERREARRERRREITEIQPDTEVTSTGGQGSRGGGEHSTHATSSGAGHSTHATSGGGEHSTHATSGGGEHSTHATSSGAGHSTPIVLGDGPPPNEVTFGSQAAFDSHMETHGQHIPAASSVMPERKERKSLYRRFTDDVEYSFRIQVAINQQTTWQIGLGTLDLDYFFPAGF